MVCRPRQRASGSLGEYGFQSRGGWVAWLPCYAGGGEGGGLAPCCWIYAPVKVGHSGRCQSHSPVTADVVWGMAMNWEVVRAGADAVVAIVAIATYWRTGIVHTLVNSQKTEMVAEIAKQAVEIGELKAVIAL